MQHSGECSSGAQALFPPNMMSLQRMSGEGMGLGCAGRRVMSRIEIDESMNAAIQVHPGARRSNAKQCTRPFRLACPLQRLAEAHLPAAGAATIANTPWTRCSSRSGLGKRDSLGDRSAVARAHASPGCGKCFVRGSPLDLGLVDATPEHGYATRRVLPIL